MMSTALLALIVAVIVVLQQAIPAEACTCAAGHPQNYYCAADYGKCHLFVLYNLIEIKPWQWHNGELAAKMAITKICPIYSCQENFRTRKVALNKLKFFRSLCRLNAHPDLV